MTNEFKNAQGSGNSVPKGIGAKALKYSGYILDAAFIVLAGYYSFKGEYSHATYLMLVPIFFSTLRK